MEYLFTFILSMTPVCELRCAIPVGMSDYNVPIFGMQGYGLAWQWVLVVAILGNMVPVVVLLPVFQACGTWLSSQEHSIGRLFRWRVNLLRRHNSSRLEKYGLWVLVMLVAIPLPLTGAWTGCIAAWALNIPTLKALPCIALGVVISGLIVTILARAGQSIL